MLYKGVEINDGDEYTAELNGLHIEGVISVQGDVIYLLENEVVMHNGDAHLKGYKYSWNASTWGQHHITNFQLKPKKQVATKTKLLKADMLKMDGRNFTAVSNRETISGRIKVVGKDVYLCQNELASELSKSFSLTERFGYDYAYFISPQTTLWNSVTVTDEPVVKKEEKTIRPKTHEEFKQCHGRRGTARYSRSGEIVPIVISISKEGYVYICQNVRDGAHTAEKFGMKHSFCTYTTYRSSDADVFTDIVVGGELKKSGVYELVGPYPGASKGAQAQVSLETNSAHWIVGKKPIPIEFITDSNDFFTFKSRTPIKINEYELTVSKSKETANFGCVTVKVAELEAFINAGKALFANGSNVITKVELSKGGAITFDQFKKVLDYVKD